MKVHTYTMSNNLQSFARRLNEMLDDVGVPRRGRLVMLARRYGITHPSAKKWLDGNGYPDTDRLIDLALWGNTSLDWLLTGRGQKHPTDLEVSKDFQDAVELLRQASPEQLSTMKAVIATLLNQPKT